MQESTDTLISFDAGQGSIPIGFNSYGFGHLVFRLTARIEAEIECTDFCW